MNYDPIYITKTSIGLMCKYIIFFHAENSFPKKTFGQRRMTKIQSYHSHFFFLKKYSDMSYRAYPSIFFVFQTV
jgi:hypothetical protein